MEAPPENSDASNSMEVDSNESEVVSKEKTVLASKESVVSNQDETNQEVAEPPKNLENRWDFIFIFR